MSIDWITVSAQIVNFLILVWLLKRFLYRPVLDAMENREQRIIARLQEAEQREQQAEEQAQKYRNKIAQLDSEREAILAKATQQSEQHKQQRLETARGEVSAIRANWQRQIDDEKDEFLNGLRQRAGETVQTIARKVLSDLADADLEQRVIQTFIARLAAMELQSRQSIIPTSGPACITSAFELDSAERELLTGKLRESLTPDLQLEFNHSPTLLCGIELTGSGQTLRWNLSDYLEKLSDQIKDAFVSIPTSAELGSDTTPGPTETSRTTPLNQSKKEV